MRHQINLREARYLGIPVVRLERDAMLQQGPRLGVAVRPAPTLPLLPPQAVIDRAGYILKLRDDIPRVTF